MSKQERYMSFARNVLKQLKEIDNQREETLKMELKEDDLTEEQLDELDKINDEIHMLQRKLFR